MEKKADLQELLKYINPSILTYQEWINVGMALKHEGYPASVWDEWSRDDSRYKGGECFKKWETFNDETGAPVTGGTICEYAKWGGYVPPHTEDDGDPGRPLKWDDVIGKNENLKIIDQAYVEDREIKEPSDTEWDPVNDLITYLQTLFDSTENVGYVTAVYEKEDRLSPQKGSWSRTAGELIQELRKYRDIGAAMGDCNPKAGAWIRFNPLDGNGIKNENVTSFRYALVESDSLPLEKQNALIRELQLPVAALVYSGGKSIHAIVRIEASDFTEYKKRVEYLYSVCGKNGLIVDTQNKNPSRLSRMPGVVRNGHKQFLIATNIGKKSWQEWEEWTEDVKDDLPNPEELADVWNDIPPLADCLIDGVLRKGHKMLLAGPSKAGKSFALIELTIAIAEGTNWLGFQCARGRVLYVNLELDRASCLHRFKDVYAALGVRPDNLKNIDIWNLRGQAVPMDKLAPKLIRRSENKHYDAVIIDPIYKVITGDENSADQMANFCNQFDKICTRLSCAVIYCHHHSKGAQGGKKSMDRASGSGVFARDPDALLDLTELELSDDLKKQQENRARIRGIEKALNEFAPGWQNDVGQDDRLSPSAMEDFANSKLNFDQISTMGSYIADAIRIQDHVTGWRIEGTLREFPAFDPLNLWFRYPIHVPDTDDLLKDIQPDDGDPWTKRKSNFARQQKEKGEETLQNYIDALEDLFEDSDEVDYKDLAAEVGKSEGTVKKDLLGAKDKRGRFQPRYSKKLKEAGYVYNNGKISRTSSGTDKNIAVPDN